MRGRNGQYIKYKLLHAIITIIVHHLVPVFDQILIFIAPSVQIRDDNVSNATSTNIQVKYQWRKGTNPTNCCLILITTSLPVLGNWTVKYLYETPSLQDLWNWRLIAKYDTLERSLWSRKVIFLQKLDWVSRLNLMEKEESCQAGWIVQYFVLVIINF